MDTRLIYLPTGEIFSDRKTAKAQLGHGLFNRAMKSRDLVAFDKVEPVIHLQDYEDKNSNQAAT